jgi:hypothetical protein
LDPAAIDQNWQEHLVKTFHVVSKHLDVVGLRNVDEVQLQSLQSNDLFGKEYSVFPTDYKDFAAHDPILWRNDVFDVVSTQMVSGTHGPDTEMHPNAIALVRLKNKVTGEEMVYMNTTLPDGKTLAAYKARQAAAINLVDLARNIEATDHVKVFVLADMSDKIGRREDKNGHFINGELASEAYCTMVGIGQLDNAYTLAHANGAQARECSRDNRMPAAQLFMTGNGAVSVDDYGKIGPKRNGTANSNLLEITVTTAAPTAGSPDSQVTDFTSLVSGAS